VIIEIENREKKIDNLFKRALSKDIIDDYELSSNFGRYLCVITSGYIEQSVKIILKEYSKNKSNNNIYRFVDIKLSNFQNADTEKIFELLDSFNINWSSKVRTTTDDKILKSVDSIVNMRHNIAHGGDQGISPNTLIGYYEDAKKMIDTLCKTCV
jgi:hypothetical protein